MAGNMITSDEMNQFRSLSAKKKVDSMELYLIGKNGYRYNMQEVGDRIFGDANYSYTVSLIHRCYNFAGQNGGRYRNGCKFEQNYGYRVTRDDIEAFVKQYPNGTYNNGVTFEDFLKTRIGRARNITQSNNSNFQNQLFQSQKPQQYKNAGNSDDVLNDKQFRGMLVFVGSLGAGILLIMLLSGNLFSNWIVSLVIFFITVGAFGGLKEM